MPTAKKVLEYWQEPENEKKIGKAKGDIWGVEQDECFACGLRLLLKHRAHIIPSINGGDNSPGNIHLLCRGCHEESEGRPNYWQWLSYKRNNEWFSYLEEVNRLLRIVSIDPVQEEKQLQGATPEEYNARLLEVCQLALGRMSYV